MRINFIGAGQMAARWFDRLRATDHDVSVAN